jgi:hypothetical protein
VNRLKTAVRRLAPLVLVAFAAGAIAAHADNAPKRRAAVRALVAPATPEPAAVFAKFPACRPARRQPSTATTPPSQALLNAFAILRRERRPEDALPAEALRALKQRRLAPVSPDSARLLRSGPGDARAWIVPVPDVTAGFPFGCAPDGKAREGIAVVALGGAAPGGGGALDDLVRGRAPVAVDPCAGDNHDMFRVSGIVPDGVAAAFLTAPDGTAVRADVKDNGYEFLIAQPRTVGQRYVVWTGGDGTPHVQPLLTFGALPAAACKRVAATAFARAPRVTPAGGVGSCALGVPSAPLPLPVEPVKRRRRVIPVPARVLWTACAEPAPALAVPSVGVRPLPAPAPVPVPPKAVPKRHR